MALRAPLFFSPPNLLLHPTKSFKPHTTNLSSSFTSSIPVPLNTFCISVSSSSSKRRKSQLFYCTAKKISDAELAIDLATELAKINKSVVQRKEAMLISKQLLFGEFCEYLGLRDEKVMKKKWRKMNEVEKMGCVQKFVSEWSLSFHPLSANSVKEMVEEHLMEENPSLVSPPPPPFLFSSLENVVAFVQGFLAG